MRTFIYFLIVLSVMPLAAKDNLSNLIKKRSPTIKTNLTDEKEIDFNNYYGAISQWLGTSDDIQSLYLNTKYQYGIPIALYQILNRADKWGVEKIVDYKYELASPLIERPLLISQNPKVIKNLPVDAHYFIYLKSNPKIRLLLKSRETWAAGEISSDIFYKNDSELLKSAQELSKDIEDELKFRSAFKGGILEFKPTESIGFLNGVETYRLTWEQIILNENIKTKLIEGTDGFLKNYNYNEWKKHGIPMSQGLLVYGPPGTGKTLLGKVIISNILKKYYPQTITYIHVQSRHINSLESMRIVYQKARELSPSVLFFEDIDLIAGTDRADRAQIKNEWMQQLSGIEELNGVLTIGTTNVESKIDPAMKRSKRLGLHFLFGLPVFSERVQLFQLLCKNPGNLSLKFDEYSNLTEGLTGADIKQICQSGTDLAIEEKIKNKSNELNLTHEIILKAIALRKKTRLVPDYK